MLVFVLLWISRKIAWHLRRGISVRSYSTAEEGGGGCVCGLFGIRGLHVCHVFQALDGYDRVVYVYVLVYSVQQLAVYLPAPAVLDRHSLTIWIFAVG